jgi:UDP-glucose 4-epimerase
MMARILVTGGAGYIGSHACVALAAAGHEPVILDNFVNSSADVLAAISSLAGRQIELFEADIRDRTALRNVFASGQFHAVIHFAGLKSVGESVAKPALYFDVNVGGTLCLIEAMQAAGVHRLVFSSSATVYGEPDSSPVREDAAIRPANPYGHTKAVVESILEMHARAEPRWRIASLRYFNPAGAHESGLIGEDPAHSANLVPRIAAAAVGNGPALTVFGDDWPTRDGTGLRDYLHVEDLVEGHLAALGALERQPGHLCVNLGTGRNVSVLELIAAFEKASGRKAPYYVAGRRPGDVAAYWGDPALAAERIGWTAKRGLEDICRSAWRYQSRRSGDKPA